MSDTKEHWIESDSEPPDDGDGNLLKAAAGIRDTFAPLAGTSPANDVIIIAEQSARDDFKTVYTGLYAAAIAELEIRSKTSGWFFLNSFSYEFEEFAHVAAEIPFSSRGGDNFLEITDLMLKFFSGDGAKGKKELVYYLRGITANNLRQILKRISRSEKKLLHYVFTAVTRHINSSPRFRRKGDIVTDLDAAETSTLRQATIFEIVGPCASFMMGREKPGELVDLVFNELDRKTEFACHLHVATLRMAVFELIKSRFISQPREITEIDPMQEYLQKELLGLAEETLSETCDSYGWREGGSASNREPYKKAGRDILEEIIVHGRKIPHHEALSRHIPECGENIYRTTHKGSFQNFWKVLWESFLKKIRADI